MAACKKLQVVESAPSVFHVSGQLSENLCEESVAVERCPLCRGSRHPLFCTDCVRKGEYGERHCKQKNFRFSSYQEGLKRLNSLILEKKTIASRIQNDLRNEIKEDEKQSEVVEHQKHISHLQLLLTEKQRSALQKSNHLYKMRLEIKKFTGRVHRNKCQMIEIKKKRISSLADHLNQLKLKQEEADTLLIERRCNLVKQLVIEVFNVEPVEANSSDEEDETVKEELADATSHQFVRGKWSYVDNAQELHYSIFGCRLAASGLYNNLITYCSSHADRGTQRMNAMRSPAHDEWAGIIYTTQLTQALSKLMDVPLPYSTYIPRFCIERMSKDELCNLVALLNYNIAYLCCSQGYDMTTFDPKQTLQNLYCLASLPNIGRSLPFKLINTSLLQSVEAEITNVNIATDNQLTADTEEEDWSMVNEMPVGETISNINTGVNAMSAGADLVRSMWSSLWSYNKN